MQFLSFHIYLFVCLLLSVTAMVYGAEDLEKTVNSEDESDNELDLSVFGLNYTKKLESSLRDVHSHFARSLLSKLGKIALYLRLYRSSIASPITGHRGFDSFFPQPPVRFHRDLYKICLMIPNFHACVTKIFDSIQRRAKFMFPLKDQQTSELLQLDVDDFARRVSNSKFSFDMSVSYLLCFLTKNKLSVLKSLPFCSYGIEDHQIKLWPAVPFRQFVDSPEISTKAEGSQSDPIDTFLNQTDFECADVSFCPDPCCGRKSLRFFPGSVNTNRTRSKLDPGFCTYSACAMNVKHLDERTVAKHFKGKAKKEEEFKTTEKSDDETTEPTTTEPTTMSSSTSETDDVNTHYCYLESPFNEDFDAIMQNRWNLSCACATANGIDKTNIYRFDVLQCVDLDECLYESCPYGQHCLNMNGGFVCACPVGFYKNASDECVQTPYSKSLLN